MSSYIPNIASEPRNPFIAGATAMSLDDVIKLLKADRGLSAVRRRDLTSSLNRVSAALGRTPSQVPADVGWIKNNLAALPDVRLAPSRKTRANILCNALAALAHANVATHRPVVPRSVEWEQLWEQLSPSCKIALGSFARFCSFHGIQPSDVSDQVVEAFRDAIDDSSLRKNIGAAIRDLTCSWNKTRWLTDGHTRAHLEWKPRRKLISVRVEDLPSSFREDFDAYMCRLQTCDLLDEAAGRPLAPATIKLRRQQILSFVGELVASGIPIAEIEDLKTMVSPSFAMRGLKAMLARRNNQSSGQVHNVAYTLLIIAKHHARLGDEDLQTLRTACSKLKVNRAGMTAKNRARLRQFDDQQHLNRLLLLPSELRREAETKNLSPKRSACLVEVALAIELLLMTGLRIKNLASLHMDENFEWTRSSLDGVCHLVVDGRDVKNGEDRDFELEGPTVSLLKAFIKEYRSALTVSSCRWLFSRREGDGPVDPVVLAKRVSRHIRRRTGLTVNVHLFRSLGAKIYLDQNPGAYEVVRRTLGHKHLSTTTAAYTGMEAVSAAKHFDRAVRRRQVEAAQKSRRGEFP